MLKHSFLVAVVYQTGSQTGETSVCAFTKSSGFGGELEEQITQALQYLGHSQFRPLQNETVIETMSGKNVNTILDTGGGKSLTFFLPSMLASKPTVVLSP